MEQFMWFLFVWLVIVAILTQLYMLYGSRWRGTVFGSGKATKAATKATKKAAKSNDVPIDNPEELIAYKQIQKNIKSEYKSQLPKTQTDFDDFCYPKSYSLQPSQIIIPDVLAPESKLLTTDSMLIFHRIGSGKSCLAIRTAEKWKSKGKPLVVMPASLMPGFRNELRSPCGDGVYISPKDAAKLATLQANSKEYNQIIKSSNDAIDQTYQIYSYNKFASDYKKINAPILIVDEIQNLINSNGKYYRILHEWIISHPNTLVILMTGTPVFDNYSELIAMARLMRIQITTPLTPTNIPKYFSGKVSFFQGAPKFTFPKVTIEIEKCKMSDNQSKWYISQVIAETSKSGTIVKKKVNNDFYIKSRQKANIVFPNGLWGDEGLAILTNDHIVNHLKTYSTKYHKLIKHLKRGELAFVYSSFTGPGGIESLVRCLEVFGWSPFNKTNVKAGKHYAIWSGDETLTEKDIIRATFNSPENDEGKLIQVIIGSPAIKEGVSLLRVRQAHILEPYWNNSRLEQIYGRVVRYCSHKRLPARERTVVIHLYAAISNHVDDSKDITPVKSVDLYMIAMANKKTLEADPYVDALINSSIDRLLYEKTKT